MTAVRDTLKVTMPVLSDGVRLGLLLQYLICHVERNLATKTICGLCKGGINVNNR